MNKYKLAGERLVNILTSKERQGLDTDLFWNNDYVRLLKSNMDNRTGNCGYNVSHCNKYLDDCKSILDVGCGWMPYEPDERYTGVDVSKSMIEIAMELHPDNTFIEASAYSLPFPDNSFDGVRSSGMLRHMKDWKPALNEMLRVASFRLAFSHVISDKPGKRVMFSWCTTLKEVCDMLPNYPQIYVVKEFRKFSSVLFMVELNKPN